MSKEQQPEFFVFQDAQGDWRWELRDVASGKRTIGGGTHAYASQNDCFDVVVKMRQAGVMVLRGSQEHRVTEESLRQLREGHSSTERSTESP